MLADAAAVVARGLDPRARLDLLRAILALVLFRALPPLPPVAEFLGHLPAIAERSPWWRQDGVDAGVVLLDPSTLASHLPGLVVVVRAVRFQRPLEGCTEFNQELPRLIAADVEFSRRGRNRVLLFGVDEVIQGEG